MGLKNNLILSPEQMKMRDEIARKLEEAQCVGAIWSLGLLQKEIKNEEKNKVLMTGKAIEDMIQSLKWSLEKQFRNKFGRNVK